MTVAGFLLLHNGDETTIKVNNIFYKYITETHCVFRKFSFLPISYNTHVVLP